MPSNSIRERIDNGPLTPMMIVSVAIAFLLNVLDGFDVIAMSVAAPSLVADWGVSRAELGPIFSAALIGMAVGAAFLAPFADRIGRRKVLFFATISIGIAMIITGQIKGGMSDVQIGGWTVSKSILWLIIIRFLAGLGVGVILANAATIASEAVPERHRDFAVLIAIMGYPFGAMLVGPLASAIIGAYSWEMVFVFGGIASLLMAGIIFLFLPESVDYLSTKSDRSERDLKAINNVLRRFKREPIEAFPKRVAEDRLKAASVKSILTPEFRVDTLGLWTTYFMGFVSVYFLLTWIPTLFVDSGYTRGQGIKALTYFNAGAVIGILIIGIWAKKIKLARPIAVFFFSSAIFLALVWFLKVKDAATLNVMIFIIGLFLQGAFTGMYALAARYYPTRVRATGIGWGAGLGRVGAILSPIIAGILAASGWGMYALFLLFAVPLLISAAMVLRFKV